MKSIPSTILLENQHISFECSLLGEDATAIKVALKDKTTGLKLESGLCEIEVLWAPIQRIEIQNDLMLVDVNQVSSEQVIFRCITKWAQIEFDLKITLENSEFTVCIPWNSIRELRQDHFRLFGIRPLANLLRSTGKEAFLVPLRCGAEIYPARHPSPFKDKFLMYGEQGRWEDLPFVPVCAMYEKNKYGIALIMEQGDCDALYEIAIEDSGRGTSGFSSRYRYYWPDPVDPIDRIFRYIMLDADSANYSGVGRRLNRFLRESWKMSTLKERALCSPEVRYSASAMNFKTFHAMKEMNNEHGTSPYHVHLTFDEMKDQLKKLKDGGVEKAYFQITGWNIDGHDGKYPQRFPVDDRLGGENGFKDLIKYGQELGFQMQVHDNHVDSTIREADFLVQSLWRTPVPRGLWAGGATYMIDPRKRGEETTKVDMLRLQNLGVKGIYYLDAMGVPLEVDYDPRNGGPRRKHAESLGWLLEKAREVFGSCGTECGFAYVMRHSDYVADPYVRTIHHGVPPNSPVQAIVDEWVPMWHIGFHGMLIHSIHDHNEPSLTRLLEAAEIGAVPRSDFTGANPDPTGPIFGCQWDDRLVPAYKAKFDILIGQLGSNQYAFIERHNNLGNECYETVFSNGCIVRVNYKEKRLFVNDKEVSIPPVFDLNLGLRAY